MNIDAFILERSALTTFRDNQVWIDQITFDIIHSIDRNHVHVQDWYKLLRINKLFEFFITSSIFSKKQSYYKFDWYMEPTDFSMNFDETMQHLRLSEFMIHDLSLKELMEVSTVLPAPDILEYVKIDISKPYTSVKNKNLDCYKVIGKM